MKQRAETTNLLSHLLKETDRQVLGSASGFFHHYNGVTRDHLEKRMSPHADGAMSLNLPSTQEYSEKEVMMSWNRAPSSHMLLCWLQSAVSESSSQWLHSELYLSVG